MADPSPLDAALSAWRAGDRQRAETLAKRAVAARPDAAEALQILGVCAAGRSEWKKAANWFGQAAAARPKDPQIGYNFAEALRKAGEADRAIVAFRATLAIAPDHVPTLVTLAMMLSDTGRAVETATLLDHAVFLAPQDPKVRLARGENGLLLGRDDAIADLRSACMLAPDLAYAHLTLGHALSRHGAYDEAEESFVKALALEPDLAAVHSERGMLAMLRNDPAAAVTHYETALASSPDDAETLALMGQALRDLHRSEDAEHAVARALVHDPRNAMARLIEAQLLRANGATEAARDRLVELLATEPDRHVTIEALTELGHALDRLGDYRGAFARFTEANILVAQNAPAGKETQRLPSRIAAMHALPRNRLAGAAKPQKQGSTGREPVFVVGFPRSGTTLIEQIIASHGDFATSDEAPLIDHVLRALDPTGDDTACGLGPLGDNDLTELRAAYWREAESRLPGLTTGKRLVDKQPWNLIELPFIARLFPTARVIVMLRDPRDACLSAFMQYFTPNPATLHFLSMEDTVATYESMMDLWAAWRDRPPLDAIEVRYEDLVGDFDAAAGRFLGFLGVAWNDSVRDFGKTARTRVIRTPSRDAVTNAISRGAIGRWRNYEAEMAPHLPRLDRFVRLFGYDA